MYYFIINEKAKTGRGADTWKEMEAVLKEQKITYQVFRTEYKGHALLLAKQISQKDEQDINLVVVGGDGTVNEVLNGIVDFSKVHFGLIPMGSGNDLARGLGIEKDSASSLMRILNCEEEYEMDLGQVSWADGKESRYFAISAGVGLDAEVCKKASYSGLKKFLNKLHLGSLTYLFLTVTSLFSMKVSDVSVSFDGKGQRNLKKAIFLAGMNHVCEGGGVPMAPKAKANDGKLSVCCTWGIPKWRTFFCLPFLVAAQHEHLKGFEVVDCKQYDVLLKNEMVLHADGEYLGDVTQVTFRCVPAALHIRL